MHTKKIKVFFLLIAIILPTLTFKANSLDLADGYCGIPINAAGTTQSPRMPSIEAYINGHFLTVTFTENLGDVQVEVTTTSGSPVDYRHVWTPDSFVAQIVNTGEYIVTITLPNGDEYYGEFEVSD